MVRGGKQKKREKNQDGQIAMKSLVPAFCQARDMRLLQLAKSTGTLLSSLLLAHAVNSRMARTSPKPPNVKWNLLNTLRGDLVLVFENENVPDDLMWSKKE